MFLIIKNIGLRGLWTKSIYSRSGLDRPASQIFFTSIKAPVKETFDEGEEVCISRRDFGLREYKPGQLVLLNFGRARSFSKVNFWKRSAFPFTNSSEPLNLSTIVESLSLYVPINTRNNPNIDIQSITVLRLLRLIPTLSSGPIIFGKPFARRGNT